MKRNLSIAALLLFFNSLSWAYDFSAVVPSGQTLYFSITSYDEPYEVSLVAPGGTSWSGYTEPTGRLIIPATVTYNGQRYGVTRIVRRAFLNCTGLTSVAIPDSAFITSIEPNAFQGCTGLTSVLISVPIYNIGSSTFQGCSSLVTVTLPDVSETLPYAMSSIGSNAFQGCSSLTNISIPNSVTNIGANAFQGCSSLSFLLLPNALTDIGSFAFEGCSSLSSIAIPNSVNNIGDSAFANTALYNNEANWNNGLLLIDSCLIASKPYLSGSPNLTGVRLLAGGALSGTQISTVVLPSTVQAISDRVFYNCPLLTDVQMPISVTSIGVDAFKGCPLLVRLVFPDNLLTIQAKVLPSQLKSVTFGLNFQGFSDSYPYNSDIVLDTLRFRGDLCMGNDSRQGWNRICNLGTPNYRPIPAIIVPCGSLDGFFANRWNRYGSLRSECSFGVPILCNDPEMLIFRDKEQHHQNQINDTTCDIKGILYCEPGRPVTLYANKKSYFDYSNYRTYSKDIVVDHWSNGVTDETMTFVPQEGDTVTLYTIDKPYATLDINNIKAPLDIFGSLGYIDNKARYGFLSDTTCTIYATGLWMSGMDGDSLHVAAHRFGESGHDYKAGPYGAAPVTDDREGNVWNHVWKMSRQTIDNHLAQVGQAGYEPVADIATWPGPYVDIDSNGYYSPLTGDYPLIRGDQALFTIFNDNTIHLESDGVAMGIEVHLMAYAFNEPNVGNTINPMNNTVFLNYSLYNRSASTYNDCYLGLFTDYDLGSAFDDYIGCDVTRQMNYCYNGDEIDGPGTGMFSGIPPAQGCVFLGGPQNSDGDRMGMDYFLYYTNSTAGSNSEPNKASDYNNYMQGRWKDGRRMWYGGDAVRTGVIEGLECNYMFPGNSDPQHIGTHGVVPSQHADDWTEETSGFYPNDRRGVSSTGPFTFLPGECHEFDVAYVSAKAEEGNRWSSAELLFEGVDAVRRQFLNDTTESSGRAFTYMPVLGPYVDIERANAVPTLHYYPNPTQSILHLTLSSPSSSTAELFDVMGRRVASCTLGNGQATIDLSAFPQGVYVLKCNGQTHRVVKR